MMSVRASLRSLVAVGALLVPGGAMCGDWQGLSIGQSGPGSESAFADAFHITSALARGGGRDVILLRDMDPAAVLASLSSWPEGLGAILYVATPALDGAPQLRGGTLPVEAMVQALAARKVTDIVLLLENCTAQDGTPVSFAMPAFASDLRVLVAQSTGNGAACPEPGSRLSDLLRSASAEASFQDVLAMQIVQDGIGVPVPVAERDASAASPLIPVAPLPGEVISVRPDILAPTADEAAPVQTVAALSPSQELGGGGVLVFAPTPSSQVAALPRAAGLPEPSIIVGVIQTSASTFAPAQEPGEVSSSEIAYDNLPAREALRAQNPTLFASLVEAGAFDPPKDLVASALQQELARMNCYTRGIDGVWGTGSRDAVELYFAEREGVEPVTVDPQPVLFRQIIVADDVQCPAQAVRASSTGKANRGNNTQQTTSSQTTKADPVATTTPAQAQPSSKRTISTTRTGIGVLK